jgi:hypothetical protein
MSKILTASLIPFLVHNAEGNVDSDATRDKFNATLATYSVKKTADLDLVRSCISEVFDWHRGMSLNTGFVVGKVIAKIGQSIPDMTPTMHAELTKRITATFREDTKAGIYTVKGGPGGGHVRTSDIPAPAPTV